MQDKIVFSPTTKKLYSYSSTFSNNNKTDLVFLLLLKFIERKKRHSKYLVLGPGARKTFRLSSRTPLLYLLTSC